MGFADRQRVHVQLLGCLALLIPVGLQAAALTLTIAPKPANSFDPRVALGAGIDGHEQGEIDQLLSPANIALMRSAGLKPLTYRLRTELAGEAWHWNPNGTWSDPGRQQGYWTGDAKPSVTPIELSYGYRLPRRGNTIDQANNDGYSRIVDGDTGTFWKSNPYLAGRPQWVAVDLGRKRSVNTVRIAWGEPHATRYHLEYSPEPYIDLTGSEGWLTLPPGETRAVRWFRLVLEESSNTAAASSTDARDRAGFAIRELAAGLTDSHGRFTDVLRHGTARDRQSVVWVSSTDPWHRASDRDPRIEQPGLDRIFLSGLTNSIPMLVPVAVLYGTPEDAAAEIAYLNARKYSFTDVELGEEPEEQFVTPQDFGSLSLKTIAAVRATGAHPRFGGPSLILLHANLETDSSWMARLLAFYRANASLDALGFFSFEWYPFDDVCRVAGEQIGRSAQILREALAKLAKAGIPRTKPWYMTEYGYSAYGAEAEVDLPGALVNAESVALFLTYGGARTYLYGYEPGELINDRSCSWGNNMLFFQGRPTATYWAAKLLAESWTEPTGGVHILYETGTGSVNVSAYALKRPSGEWSILLLNKSAARETMASPFSGSFAITQFSSAQYLWKAAGESSRVIRSAAPAHRIETGSTVALPPFSLTVITGSRPNV
ncbi:MAG: discoidin domain-containing protein [Acidobacteriota bacterium]|nr:discoidin domain-containing protein [Acidobacteriota bacterium]